LSHAPMQLRINSKKEESLKVYSVPLFLHDDVASSILKSE